MELGLGQAQEQAEAGVDRLREQLGVLARERQEDVQQISELVQEAQTRATKELQAVKALAEAQAKGVRDDVSQALNELREGLLLRLEQETQDKVRVDEVQDALRRLTESFQSRLEGVHQDLRLKVETKSEDSYRGLERLKADLDSLSSALDKQVGEAAAL